MTQPVWTPASRPGIVPLHPLSFGTILGRSFTALRGNPRVLLGFAIGVQLLAYIAVIVVVGLVAWGSFSRLDTLRPGSDEYEAVLTGSIALTAVAAFVLGLAASALSAIVQGIVVREVAHAVLAEKLTLRALWRQFTPVAWRLIGYAFLLLLAVLVLVAVVTVGVVAIGFALPALAIVLAILLVLAAIPLYLWLATKLLLVPSVIVLERATVWQAVARSWRLIRGRFWVALGVLVLISFVFGFLAQAISIPFSFLTSGLTTVIAPTGDPGTGAFLLLIVSGLLTQVLAMLVQAIALVVQGTASALVYVDCRMRHEGLDLDLLQYVERRDAGATDLPDPYTLGIGRLVAPRPAPGYAPAPYAGMPVPGYPAPLPSAPPAQSPYGAPPVHSAHAAAAYPTAPGYPTAPAYPPAPGYPAVYPTPPSYPGQPAQPAQPAYPVPPLDAAPAPAPAPWESYAPPQATPAVPDPAAPEPAEPESPTTWAAPGAPPPAGPESPWR